MCSGPRSEPSAHSTYRYRSALEPGHLRVNVAEMVEGPDAEPRAAVDAVAPNRSEVARVLRFVAVVAHDEILVGRDHRTVGVASRGQGPVAEDDPCLGHVRFDESMPVYVDDSVAVEESLAGQGDDPLDEVGRIVVDRKSTRLNSSHEWI